MFDSVTATSVPPDCDMVAGYVDGIYAWSEQDWARFPTQTKVRIAVHSTTLNAQVLDIEPGNGDALVAADWTRRKRERGEVPTVYCFSGAGPIGYRIGDVRRACAEIGVEPPLIWLTQWDNDPSTFDPSGDPTIIAKQYAGSAQTGGHYDASVVADFWPGVDEEDDMDDEAFLERVTRLYGARLQKQLEDTVYTPLNDLRTEYDKHKHDTTIPTPGVV